MLNNVNKLYKHIKSYALFLIVVTIFAVAYSIIKRNAQHFTEPFTYDQEYQLYQTLSKTQQQQYMQMSKRDKLLKYAGAMH